MSRRCIAAVALSLAVAGCAHRSTLSDECSQAFARGQTTYRAADGLTHACPMSRAPKWLQDREGV